MKRDEAYMEELVRALWESDNSSEPALLLPPKNLFSAKKAHHLALLLDGGLVGLTSQNDYRLTDKGHDYMESLGAASKSGPTMVV